MPVKGKGVTGKYFADEVNDILKTGANLFVSSMYFVHDDAPARKSARIKVFLTENVTLGQPSLCTRYCPLQPLSFPEIGTDFLQDVEIIQDRL
jgi:hypothetical protein